MRRCDGSVFGWMSVHVLLILLACSSNNNNNEKISTSVFIIKFKIQDKNDTRWWQCGISDDNWEGMRLTEGNFYSTSVVLFFKCINVRGLIRLCRRSDLLVFFFFFCISASVESWKMSRCEQTEGCCWICVCVWLWGIEGENTMGKKLRADARGKPWRKNKSPMIQTLSCP